MSYSASDSAPLRTGAVAGVGAFVAGLVLTFIIGVVDLDLGVGQLVGTLPVRGTLFAFLSFHFWPVVLGLSIGGLFLWTVVPVVVLLVAGYVTAASAATRLSNGFKNGASITSGYLALTVVGFLLLVVTGGGQGMRVGGELGTFLVGIIVTGVFFPVVFGGIGGAIADGM